MSAKSFWRFVLRFLVPLLVGILLVRFAFKGQNIAHILQVLSTASIPWIVASILFSIISHWSRAVRWNYLLKPMGYTPKITNTFSAVMIGYLANLILPRMGEVSRCGALSKSEKMPMNYLFGTVIVERSIDLLSLLILGGITFVTKYAFFQSLIQELFQGKTANRKPSILLFIVLFGFAIVVGIVVFMLRKHYGFKRLIVKVKGFIKGVGKGFLTIKKLQNPWSFVGHTLLMWFMYFMVFYACCLATTPTAVLTPGEGLFSMIMGSIGVVAPVQGGIGAFHALAALTISSFPTHHISYEDALAFATLTHGIQMAVMIVLGLLGYLYLSIINTKKHV